MQFTIEEVSPETARQYLERAGQNRRLSMANVRRYATAMKAGYWQLNGETVKFSPSGELIDGQHRLRAVVEAGVPVRLAVIRGINGTAFETFDLGKGRTLTDVLSIYGYDNAAGLAAVIRSIYFYKRFGDPDSKLRPAQATPVAEFMDYFKASPNHDLMVTSTAKGLEYRVRGSFFSPRIASFLWVATTLAKPETAADFWTDFGSADLQEGHPIQVFRRRIKNDMGMKGTMSAMSAFAIAVKCWNAYATGVVPEWFKFVQYGRTAEPFPEVVGLNRETL